MTKTDYEFGKQETVCAIHDGYIDLWDERVPTLSKLEKALLEIILAGTLRQAIENMETNNINELDFDMLEKSNDR